MKKFSILFIIIFCLIGCKKGVGKLSISGEIKGLKNDTIYLYGIDGAYDRIDTIYAKNGKFSYTIKTDTTSSAFLLLNNKTEYPVFLTKGNNIRIQGDANNLDCLTIEGNTFNEELTSFLRSFKKAGIPLDKIPEEKTEEFIQQHKSSLVSLYILDKYFVQKKSPNFTKIKDLIKLMEGNLQDTPYIIQLTDYINDAEKNGNEKYAPFFNLLNTKGEHITRSSDKLKQKYLLINFWASWGDNSLNTKANKKLHEIYKAYKKSKDFAMLGISLDINKEAWKKAIKRDSLNWEQVCDSGGMNSETAKQYAIRKLPMNILLSPDGKILAQDIQEDSLTKKLKELLSEEKKNK